MLPLYATRIEDFRRGDFVKVDCAACHHVALLAPEALLRVGLSPGAKVLDLKGQAPVPRVRKEGAGGRLDQVAGAERVTAKLNLTWLLSAAGQGAIVRTPRERSGAGWGTLSTPLPARLGPTGSDHQARLDPTGRRSTESQPQ